MPLTHETKHRHQQTQSKVHDTCLLCGTKNPIGLKLEFAVEPDGAVQTQFMCQFRFEGYKGFLHGGVTAALIDSAMTNCLFSKSITALTAELTVRYKKPVRCGKPALIKAWEEKSYPPLHILRAEITQEGEIVATAEAKFMESDAVSGATP